MVYSSTQETKHFKSGELQARTRYICRIRFDIRDIRSIEIPSLIAIAYPDDGFIGRKQTVLLQSITPDRLEGSNDTMLSKKSKQKRDALLFAEFDPPYHNGNNSHPCHKETEDSEKNVHPSNDDFAPLVSGKTGANEPSEETKSDERKSRPQKKTEQNGADH